MWKIYFLMIQVVLAASAEAEIPDFNVPHHPTRVLVQFKAEITQAAKDLSNSNAGALQVLEEYSAFNGLELVEVGDGKVPEAVIKYLADSNVLFAEPDYERYSTAECNSNDPHLLPPSIHLWGIKQVRAPEAWCLTTGNQDFLVAVIDRSWHQVGTPRFECQHLD